MDRHAATTDPNQPARPTAACLLCPPPRTHAWRLADRGYRTCTNCYDKLRDLLKEIAERYQLLDPRPGASGEHGSRGAPGFGSRAPASEHIIAMRDRRSSSVARTWLGRDGRVHQESERPPLSVHNVLDLIAWEVAEHRSIDGPTAALDVHELCRWIDGHLDWITRHDTVTETFQMLRDLLTQLRPVTGEPGRRHIGLCPNVLDDGEHTRECAARLYAPLKGDSIECRQCQRIWPRSEWLRLGDLLEAS